MANNFDSNFTNKLMRVFLEKFESTRVLSKNVNTQLLSNAFNPSTGDTVFFKRPTDYTSFRNATGDLTASTASDIITGKASGVVQDYITVHVDYDEADEAIKMDQLDQLLAPMATRISTDLELDFAAFMMKNSGLLAGAPGTSVTTWDHVAEAGAMMSASGIPMDDQWNYAVNPFTQTKLASDQRSLGAGGVAGDDINRANRMAVINEDFAGMRVMKANTLASFTTPATGDTAGVVGVIDITYATAKDTMTQTIAVTGFGAFAGVIKAGTVVQVTGRNRLNMSTRQPIIDDTGANRLFTAVVTADSAAFVAGAGTLVVSGPGIFEASGAYNTTDTAIIATDVITILNADSTLFQPNLFWHKQAFSIGSVPIKKLHSTDTLGTTEDGLQIRISKGSDFTKNSQQVRFDLRPSFAVLNPFFAGQSFG